jgi:hypothetical protein
MIGEDDGRMKERREGRCPDCGMINDMWIKIIGVIKSVVGSLVVEFVSDVELNVGILSQNVEGDEKEEGVYVGGTLRQLEVDVDPDPSKHQQHCYRHQCPYFQTGLV